MMKTTLIMLVVFLLLLNPIDSISNYLIDQKLKNDILYTKKYNPFGFPTNGKLKVETGIIINTPYDVSPSFQDMKLQIVVEMKWRDERL